METKEKTYHFKSNGQEDLDGAVKSFSSLFLLLCGKCKNSDDLSMVVKDREKLDKEKSPTRFRIDISCSKCKTKFTCYAG